MPRTELRPALRTASARLALVLLALACKDTSSPEPPSVLPPEQSLIRTSPYQILPVPRTLQVETDSGDGIVTWESSDHAVATVSASGLVTARFPGAATITARRGFRRSTLSVTATASRIDVAPSSASIAQNARQPLTATVFDADGAVLNGVTVLWTTGNGTIARVNAITGEVTGIGGGSTLISAAGGGATADATVTVEPLPDEPRESLVFSSIGFGNHTCGLEARTGLAYCWGDNHAGALGLGDREGSDSPQAVSGARAFSSLTVAYYATCGIEAQTGFAYCWGDNSAGDLGDGTVTTRWIPTLVGGGRIRFSSISASGGLTCGIEAQTELGYCWGKGGLIGDGTLSQRSTPTLVSGNRRFSSISASGSHACGVESETGLAFCWGTNVSGELGDGTTSDRLVPALVSGGSRRFTSIDAGAKLTCGIEAVTALAYCWGQNDYGQVGDGTTTFRLTPTPIGGGNRRFSSVVAGDMTCGIEAETGLAYCWGRNDPIPTQVGGNRRFSSISARWGWACGVEAETGRGYFWHYSRLVSTPSWP